MPKIKGLVYHAPAAIDLRSARRASARGLPAPRPFPVACRRLAQFMVAPPRAQQAAGAWAASCRPLLRQRAAGRQVSAGWLPGSAT